MIVRTVTGRRLVLLLSVLRLLLPVVHSGISIRLCLTDPSTNLQNPFPCMKPEAKGPPMRTRVRHLNRKRASYSSMNVFVSYGYKVKYAYSCSCRCVVGNYNCCSVCSGTSHMVFYCDFAHIWFYPTFRHLFLKDMHANAKRGRWISPPPSSSEINFSKEGDVAAAAQSRHPDPEEVGSNPLASAFMVCNGFVFLCGSSLFVHLILLLFKFRLGVSY